MRFFSCLKKTTKRKRVQPSTLANLTKSTGTHTNTVGHLPRQSHQSTSNADLCLSPDDSPLNKDEPTHRSQGFEDGICSPISSTTTKRKGRFPNPLHGSGPEGTNNNATKLDDIHPSSGTLPFNPVQPSTIRATLHDEPRAVTKKL